jgi:Protein of unknown function (DUF3050)
MNPKFEHNLSAALLVSLRRSQAGLAQHRVFGALHDLSALRSFMQHHVFAVWDFMTLVKRLQRDLTCIELPWTPPANAAASRLINEIVVGEESDVLADGTPISHFEMYRRAMQEVGAATDGIDGFVQATREGAALETAFERGSVPTHVRSFVRETLATARQGNTTQVLATFLFGRESAIPLMFRRLLASWRVPTEQAPTFVYYLERHIHLDTDAHGPAAQRLLGFVAARDGADEHDIGSAAMAAIRSRQELWDGVLAALRPRLA